MTIYEWHLNIKVTLLLLFYLLNYKQKRKLHCIIWNCSNLGCSHSPQISKQVIFLFIINFCTERMWREGLSPYQTAHGIRLHSLLVRYADGKLSVDPEFLLFVLAKLNFLVFPCGWSDAFGDPGLSWEKGMFIELFSRNRALWLWIASPAGYRNENHKKPPHQWDEQHGFGTSVCVHFFLICF